MFNMHTSVVESRGGTALLCVFGVHGLQRALTYRAPAMEEEEVVVVELYLRLETRVETFLPFVPLINSGATPEAACF